MEISFCTDGSADYFSHRFEVGGLEDKREVGIVHKDGLIGTYFVGESDRTLVDYARRFERDLDPD